MASWPDSLHIWLHPCSLVCAALLICHLLDARLRSGGGRESPAWAVPSSLCLAQRVSRTPGNSKWSLEHQVFFREQSGLCSEQGTDFPSIPRAQEQSLASACAGSELSQHLSLQQWDLLESELLDVQFPLSIFNAFFLFPVTQETDLCHWGLKFLSPLVTWGGSPSWS